MGKGGGAGATREQRRREVTHLRTVPYEPFHQWHLGAIMHPVQMVNIIN
jgi:hypothetical protein